MFTFILMGNRPYFHLLEANLSHIAKHYPDAAVMFYDWGLKPGQRLRLKDRHPVLEIIDWKDRISRRGNLFDVPELERIGQAAAKFTSELSQIECTLPGDRWTLRKSDERDRRERVRVWIKDSENVANMFFLELNRPRRHKYETIDEWIEKRVIPRWLERYGKDDYTVQSKDKGKRRWVLGSA